MVTICLVVDGPLRGRSHLPRALGYIKSHRAAYLPSGAALDGWQIGCGTTHARVSDGHDLGPAFLVSATALPAQCSLVRHRPGRMLP